MKHPFWLANDVLLFLLLATVVFIFFSRPKLIKRAPFLPSEEVRPIKKDIAKIDLSKIYTNDLFNTYKQPLPPPKKPDLVKSIPSPPQPRPIPKPAIVQPKFLEPLNINLRGIIVSSNEQTNIAIIEDSKSKEAKNYKINEKIEDAHLIRILKNKIILIRSNGQQETLYVNQDDAELEKMLSPESDWSPVVKKINSNEFAVDPDLFVERVPNLAHIIDILNLTTVYRQGNNIGARIGSLPNKQFCNAFGLAQNDIITTVNSIPATDSTSRFEIYKSIIALKVGDTFTVKLLRQNKPVTLTYTLEKQETTSVVSTTTAQATPIPDITLKTPAEIENEKLKILEQKYRFAPTAEELQKKQKENMLKISHIKRPQIRRDTLLNTMRP